MTGTPRAISTNTCWARSPAPLPIRNMMVSKSTRGTGYNGNVAGAWHWSSLRDVARAATRRPPESRKFRRLDRRQEITPCFENGKIGEDYERAGDINTAIEIFKINLLAYPDSADANDDLSSSYLADGQKDLARQYAENALALLDSHKAPASSWSDVAIAISKK
jgi:hypothetical protein